MRIIFATASFRTLDGKIVLKASAYELKRVKSDPRFALMPLTDRTPNTGPVAGFERYNLRLSSNWWYGTLAISVAVSFGIRIENSSFSGLNVSQSAPGVGFVCAVTAI